MRTVLLVGLGSFIGGAGRYMLSMFIQNKAANSFPYGTLTVNVLGCFLIGIVLGVSARSGIPHEWRLFLATGILGGFTTFSAFSYESITLIRDGNSGTAIIYIGCSILLGLMATYGGIWAVSNDV